MDLCNESCSTVRLADQPGSLPSCVTRTIISDIAHKLFKQNLFICAMPIGTISFYHFIPLSLTLTLAVDHKRQSTISWLHFLPHFSAE